jgi:hypothetical protein
MQPGDQPCSTCGLELGLLSFTEPSGRRELVDSHDRRTADRLEDVVESGVHGGWPVGFPALAYSANAGAGQAAVSGSRITIG